jgi:hypothetical protein
MVDILNNERSGHEDEGIDLPLGEQDVVDLSETEDQQESNAKYNINSYGADYPIDGLVERLRRKDIYIPTFQREYVWTPQQGSSFIESLIMGLPVPGIFLTRDQDKRLMVIDGQQRLKTLQKFYDNELKLRSRLKRLDGRTYATLESADRRELNDSILHATIVQQYEPKDDDSSIYHIFERLNSGGTMLEPQEIRVALYGGEFQKLIQTLNDYPAWRDLYGDYNLRAKDQELILRFFALYFERDNYRRPLDEFLNSFMQKHRHIDVETSKKFTELFTRTVDTIHQCLGRSAFRPEKPLNAAVYDAVMIGIATALERAGWQLPYDCERLKEQLELLLQDLNFIRAYKAGTTAEEKVETRIKMAIQAFA